MVGGRVHGVCRWRRASACAERSPPPPPLSYSDMFNPLEWAYHSPIFFFLFVTFFYTFLLKLIALRIYTGVAVYYIFWDLFVTDALLVLAFSITLTLNVYLLLSEKLKGYLIISKMMVRYPTLIYLVSFIVKLLYLHYTFKIGPSDEAITWGTVVRHIVLDHRTWDLDEVFVECAFSMLVLLLMGLSIFGKRKMYLFVKITWRDVLQVVLYGYIVRMLIQIWIYNIDARHWFEYYGFPTFSILYYGTGVLVVGSILVWVLATTRDAFVKRFPKTTAVLNRIDKILKRLWTILMFFVSVFVGIVVFYVSGIYLGVLWTSPVASAIFICVFCVGLLIVLIVRIFKCIRARKSRSQRRSHPPTPGGGRIDHNTPEPPLLDKEEEVVPLVSKV